jgi:hypothetical protein
MVCLLQNNGFARTGSIVFKQPQVRWTRRGKCLTVIRAEMKWLLRPTKQPLLYTRDKRRLSRDKKQ